MANDLFSWLSLSVCMLLVVACVSLYLDGRGQRRSLRAAQSTLDALQRRVAAQDQQIGHLTRALALLVPADARPTTPHHHIVGLSRPYKPSPEQVAMARAAWAEAKASPPPDTEGDRGGIIPGDPIPSESAQEIRARFEAEADVRSQARLALPSVASDDEPEDERTRVYSGRSRRRPTLLGGLAGHNGVKSPIPSAPAAAPPPPPEDTLVSAGNPPSDAANDSGDVIVVAQREDGTPLSDREGPSD